MRAVAIAPGCLRPYVNAGLLAKVMERAARRLEMRFVIRLIGLFFLVIAVISGVVDAIRSVASEAVALSPLGTAWFELSPRTLDTARAVIERSIHPYLWDPLIAWVLLQPATVVFLALSLVFHLIGYRRPRLAGRFAA